MNIDELARSAAHEARAVAANGLDPAGSLVRLHRTRRNRMLGSTAAVAAVLAVAAGIAVAQTSHDAKIRPAHPSVSPAPRCAPGVTCLGNRRFRIWLPVPVDVTVPANFKTGFNYAPGAVDAYRSDLDHTGVAIIEGSLQPVKDSIGLVRDPSAGNDARSVADWLSKRPFLKDTSVTRVSVGGRTAWRVDASLKRGASLRAHKIEVPIAPVFDSGGTPLGYGRELVGDWILLDSPAGGLIAIWSWSDGDGRPALAANQAFIDGLSFGSP